MRLHVGPDLPGLKATLSAEIDAAAEIARARFVTPGAGQSATYSAKVAEAHRVVAGESNVPFLSAEASATGKSLRDIAEAVLRRASEQADAFVAIETLRIAAKAGVAAASTPAQARIAAAVRWPGG